MELFDSQETCRALMPKVIRSYALDAIDPMYGRSGRAKKQSPDSFLKQILKAATHEAKAVGEGTDLRFDNTSGLAGGFLVARKRVIHVVAFVMASQAPQNSDRVYRRYAM